LTHVLLQRLDFLGRQFAVGTHGQIAKHDWADGNSTQPEHLVFDPREHPSNLAIASFAKHDDQFARLARLLSQSNRFGASPTFGQPYPLAQHIDVLERRAASHHGLVGLLDPEPRMREPIGQRAVVGDQNESFARAIQATDGKNSLLGRNQIDHTRPTARVVIRTDDSSRLIQCVVDSFGLRQSHSIDPNFATQRVDLRAELGHGLLVDLDTPRLNQLFALPSASDSRRGEHFLQPLVAGRIRRVVGTIDTGSRARNTTTASHRTP